MQLRGTASDVQLRGTCSCEAHLPLPLRGTLAVAPTFIRTSTSYVGGMFECCIDYMDTYVGVFVWCMPGGLRFLVWCMRWMLRLVCYCQTLSLSLSLSLTLFSLSFSLSVSLSLGLFATA